MSRVLVAGICAVIWAVPVRAADTHESLADEAVKCLNKLADFLGSIKETTSAEEAKAKVAVCVKELTSVKKRADKLGDPSPEKKEELERKYKPKIDAATKKLVTEMHRIAKLEGGAQIVKDLSDLLNPPKKK